MKKKIESKKKKRKKERNETIKQKNIINTIKQKKNKY